MWRVETSTLMCARGRLANCRLTLWTLLARASIIVAWPTPAAIAAQQATATIPIIMVGIGDLVGTGLVASLARPGANITGFANLGSDLSAKQVELLAQVVGGATRIGIVANPENPAVVSQLSEVETAVRVLGLKAEIVNARLAEEYKTAFDHLSRAAVNAVLVVPDPSVIEHRVIISAAALKGKLATVFQRRENVEAGGLMSYGPHLTDQFRQILQDPATASGGSQPLRI